jgi:membrane protease YdiL (CAAX protease family)
MISARLRSWLSRPPFQEALLAWGLSFAAILLATLLLPDYAKPVATLSFLFVPMIFMRRRGEDYWDYGLSFRCWRLDLKLALLLFLIVAPLYLLSYEGYAEALKYLPSSWVKHLSPYGADWSFHPRLPSKFPQWTVDQLLVVALPEELFYRGYLQTRLRQAYPQGRMFLGARLGPAFFITAVLFALGHLAIFQVWRLAVFFPALLFGWLRERTGTVIGSSVFHAACNLYELVLRASFFGPA